MLVSSDPRIASAMTSDASALTLLNQLHLEVAHTQDAYVLSVSLGQYAAICASRIARRKAATQLRSAISSPWEQFLQAQSSTLTSSTLMRSGDVATTISNILKKVAEESQNVINNLK
jgi:hypothetical protein